MYPLNHTKKRAFPPYQQRIFHTRAKKKKKKRERLFLFSRSNRKIEQSSTDPIPSRLKKIDRNQSDDLPIFSGQSNANLQEGTAEIIKKMQEIENLRQTSRIERKP